MSRVDVVLPYIDHKTAVEMVASFRSQSCCHDIFLVSPDATEEVEGAKLIKSVKPLGTDVLREVNRLSRSHYVLFSLGGNAVFSGADALERLVQVSLMTGSSFVYSDYYEVKSDRRALHPLTSYQEGSVRDNFNFGAAQLVSNDVLNSWNDSEKIEYHHAGFYSLRLFASRNGGVSHLPEPLFTMEERDLRASGQKQHDYVNPSARGAQIEFEIACSQHLQEIDAFLDDKFETVDLVESFENEVSVIIPVLNRIKTIKDAIESVLTQKTNFPFNIIVVDNHSSDGTSELLAAYAAKGDILHVVPERKDLGIGGCWNYGVAHPACGKFSVQLDSDDLYSGVDTLQQIVDVFYEEKCAMVIGSYQMTNFDLEEIPPGIVDHEEWTDENGPNNALRINGLGAPRAFYTPILRELKLPNTSYGEDYAIGLAISRNYRIGRIFDPIYLCRRWEDNSDATLDVLKENAHNYYKDSLRTFEIVKRKALLKERRNKQS